jgi:hypothetical protein
MYGDQPQLVLELVQNTMFLSLMLIANTLGFIPIH